jgi:hypothetical protein
VHASGHSPASAQAPDRRRSRLDRLAAQLIGFGQDIAVAASCIGVIGSRCRQKWASLRRARTAELTAFIARIGGGDPRQLGDACTAAEAEDETAR